MAGINRGCWEGDLAHWGYGAGGHKEASQVKEENGVNEMTSKEKNGLFPAQKIMLREIWEEVKWLEKWSGH